MSTGKPWLDVREADGVAHVTINRPETLNAVDPALIHPLISQMQKIH